MTKRKPRPNCRHVMAWFLRGATIEDLATLYVVMPYEIEDALRRAMKPKRKKKKTP